MTVSALKSHFEPSKSTGAAKAREVRAKHRAAQTDVVIGGDNVKGTMIRLLGKRCRPTWSAPLEQDEDPAVLQEIGRRQLSHLKSIGKRASKGQRQAVAKAKRLKERLQASEEKKLEFLNMAAKRGRLIGELEAEIALLKDDCCKAQEGGRGWVPNQNLKNAKARIDCLQKLVVQKDLDREKVEKRLAAAHDQLEMPAPSSVTRELQQQLLGRLQDLKKEKAARQREQEHNHVLGGQLKQAQARLAGGA